MKTLSVTAQQIAQAHALYCQLTGQILSLGFDRERHWYELLRLGHGPEQIRRVIVYLQREIRAERRNVGALKLSNLLQPDRFEEDLNISQVRLKLAPRAPPANQRPPLDPAKRAQSRLRALECIRKMKQELQFSPDPGNNLVNPTEKSE
jgi:hypothetical protein